jgi:Ubiquitin family
MAASSAPSQGTWEITGTPLNFTIKHGKNIHDTSGQIGSGNTVGDLRSFIQLKTNIPGKMQKVMFKGLLKDDAKTLEQAGIAEGVKVMVIGSSIQAVMKATTVPAAGAGAGAGAGFDDDAGEEKGSIQEETKHRKVLEKGVPEGVTPGIAGAHESLPDSSIQGVLNNIGLKVRLTFKKFTEEVWIQSASNTQKIHFAQIRKITAEPIVDHPEYHVVGLQLGSGEGR